MITAKQNIAIIALTIICTENCPQTCQTFYKCPYTAKLVMISANYHNITRLLSYNYR